MKTKLDLIAIEARQNMLPKNYYVEDDRYTQSHPNATQAQGVDDPNNARGKGTGVKFDFDNGGSNIDINGDPSLLNTGRNAINQNLYTPGKKYTVVL